MAWEKQLKNHAKTGFLWGRLAWKQGLHCNRNVDFLEPLVSVVAAFDHYAATTAGHVGQKFWKPNINTHSWEILKFNLVMLLNRNLSLKTSWLTSDKGIGEFNLIHTVDAFLPLPSHTAATLLRIFLTLKTSHSMSSHLPTPTVPCYNDYQLWAKTLLIS